MSKTIKTVLITLLAAFAVMFSFQVGYYAGVEEGRTSLADDPHLASIEEAWSNIKFYYVENDDIDYDLLTQFAIEGMLDYLNDSHSAYLDPQEFASDAESMAGSYSGIGVLVSVANERFVVVKVYDDSPAAEAGLLEGDFIQAVNGESTAEMSLDELVSKVRGEEGTTVTLSVMRHDGLTSKDLNVIRGKVIVPSVHLEMIDEIAYVRIDQFAQETDKEFSKILKELQDNGATGIVLDLRSNPGGLLQTVLNIASCFYTEGNVLTVKENDGKTKKYNVNKQSVTTNLPVVVLVDRYSASASEVLAGALQDHNRAQIAGTITYGKGSVNIMFELPNMGGLYLTTARWYTPNGNLIEGIGITPDIITDLEGEELINWAVDYLLDR
ncbi:MAG: S41 family peptidase [Dehalococcoidales bacterium]